MLQMLSRRLKLGGKLDKIFKVPQTLLHGELKNLPDQSSIQVLFVYFDDGLDAVT